MFTKNIIFIYLCAVSLTLLSFSWADSPVAKNQTESYKIPFQYPNPRTIGVIPFHMNAQSAGAMTPNRYAGISEPQRQARIYQEQRSKVPQLPCPLCEDNPQTPCGTCEMCKAGFPCEKALCRHCVQPRSKNMGNSCDLAAGDKPCGTCDACREHRSDPCEHADDGYGPRGEFNPYKEPRLLSVIPRPILDTYNNGARKFPVYYNPAPYYRPTWNPSLFAGYARPYTFRWSCSVCFNDPCICSTEPLAGQVPYAYTCKFCKRNPCACAQEICNVTKPMDPRGIAAALAKIKEATEPGGNAGPVELQEGEETESTDSPKPSSSGTDVNKLLEDDTLEENPATNEESEKTPIAPITTHPRLDGPAPIPLPAAGSRTMS